MSEIQGSLYTHFEHHPRNILIGQGVGFVAARLCLQSGVSGVIFGAVFMAAARLIELVAMNYFSKKFDDGISATIATMGVDALGRGLIAWTFTCIFVGCVSIFSALFFTATLYAIDIAVRMKFDASN